MGTPLMSSPSTAGKTAAIIDVGADPAVKTNSDQRPDRTLTLSQHDLAEANEAIFSLLGVVGGIVLGGQVSWLQVTIGFENQSAGVQVSTAFGIIGVIFNTVGTAGSLLTARWFRLLGPVERNYLHQRWDVWMRKSRGEKGATEPILPDHSEPHQKREGIVALTLLIPIVWVIGGFASFVASLIIFTFATQPYASAVLALILLILSATFLPFYFVGHSTARVCRKLYIKRKQL
ncbi:hypothetical protein VKT23_018931 [Stygiomarasmius scandens]|uniref:Uncharacterized protein n=1 Tax=Marasmiellus scandens TaxID=2682957 RepID=A0ABR1IQA3_9AGAR